MIEEALKRIPGKAIINSINLEDGEKRTSKVLPMAKRYGAARLVAYMAEVMDYSERLMRAALADLPDGEGFFEDFCDGDGIPDRPDGTDAPFWVRMRVAKSGDSLSVDPGVQISEAFPRRPGVGTSRQRQREALTAIQASPSHEAV